MSVQVREGAHGVVAGAGQDALGEGSEGEVRSLVVLAPDDPGDGREERGRGEDASRVGVEGRQEALVRAPQGAPAFIRAPVELKQTGGLGPAHNHQPRHAGHKQSPLSSLCPWTCRHVNLDTHNMVSGRGRGLWGHLWAVSPLKSLQYRCLHSAVSRVMAPKCRQTADSITTERTSSSRKTRRSSSGGSAVRPNATGSAIAAGRHREASHNLLLLASC